MIIYGHRGSKGTIIENCLNGFVKNLNNGITHFELDIQLTADKQLVVFHDTNLKRLTGIDASVKSKTLAELTATKLIGTNECIPSLHDIVDACQEVLYWQFEIKTHTADPNFIPAMQSLIEEFNLGEKIVITSKHFGILKRFKKALPHIKTGLVQEWPIPFSMFFAHKMKCDYLCINKTLARASYVKSAQKLGMHLSVWTVNNLDDMKYLQKIGVNSVISDYPQTCRHFYQSFNENN